MNLVYKVGVVLLSLSVMLSGCSRPSRDLPAQPILEQYMVSLVADLGVNNVSGISRMVGKHYYPGDDVWQMIACYQFTLPSDQQGNECNDSFRLIPLDNGQWIITATRQGVYRWREIGRNEAAPPAQEKSTQ